MKHFERIATGIDVAPLRAQLAAHPELWDQHSSRKASAGTPHREMSDIWVRYRDYADLETVGRERFNDIHVSEWYPAWHVLTEIKPIVLGLMACVHGEMLGGILITKIPHGSGIAPHTDRGWHVETYRKFYVSVDAGVGARFHCNHSGEEEFIEPRPGECWLFDNRKVHWVTNESGKARVTVIICIRTEMFGYD